MKKKPTPPPSKIIKEGENPYPNKKESVAPYVMFWLGVCIIIGILIYAVAVIV